MFKHFLAVGHYLSMVLRGVLEIVCGAELAHQAILKITVRDLDLAASTLKAPQRCRMS
jgi:hypothetical protein